MLKLILLKIFEELEGKEIFFLYVDVMLRCNKLFDCKLIKYNKMLYVVWGILYFYRGDKFKERWKNLFKVLVKFFVSIIKFVL